VIVNNAGVLKSSLLQDLDEANWDALPVWRTSILISSNHTPQIAQQQMQ